MPSGLRIDIVPPTPGTEAFFYSPLTADSMTPPSPTSSTKGCFVRSRPTSAEWSEYDASEFIKFGMEQTSSSEDSDITTPATSITDEVLERASIATERWAHSQMQARDSDLRSLAPSTLTCTDRGPIVPVRITRRANAEVDAGAKEMDKERKDENGQDAGADKASVNARRRTWPSYKAIRKSVNNILHRKDGSGACGFAGATSVVPGREAPAAEKIKSSSASMFTRRHRATVSDENAGAKIRPSLARRAFPSRARASSDAVQYRAQLRRSRSFSGFANVLTVIEDAGDDDNLDEVATEARGVALEIGRRWQFEEVDEDAALMFERCIE